MERLGKEKDGLETWAVGITFFKGKIAEFSGGKKLFSLGQEELQGGNKRGEEKSRTKRREHEGAPMQKMVTVKVP